MIQNNGVNRSVLYELLKKVETPRSPVGGLDAES